MPQHLHHMNTFLTHKSFGAFRTLDGYLLSVSELVVTCDGVVESMDF